MGQLGQLGQPRKLGGCPVGEPIFTGFFALWDSWDSLPLYGGKTIDIAIARGGRGRNVGRGRALFAVPAVPWPETRTVIGLEAGQGGCPKAVPRLSHDNEHAKITRSWCFAAVRAPARESFATTTRERARPCRAFPRSTRRRAKGIPYASRAHVRGRVFGAVRACAQGTMPRTRHLKRSMSARAVGHLKRH